MNFISLWKSAKWYVLSSLTSKVLVFLSIPFYTKYLSVEEYGAVETAMSMSQLCAVIISLYMDTALIRYFHFSDSKEKKKKLLSVIFSFVSLYGLFALGCIIAVGPWLVESVSINFVTFVLAIISVYLGQLNNLFIIFLKQEINTKKVFYLESISSITSIILGLTLLIAFKQGEYSKFIGLILGAVFLLLTNLYIFFRENLISFNLDRKLIKELVYYSLPFIPNYIGSWIMDLSDRLVLAKISNLTSVAIYSVANQLSRIIYIAQDAMTKVQYPYAMKALVSEDEFLLTESKKMNVKILAFTMIIYMGMVIYIDLILKIFQKEEYLQAKWAFVFLGISFLFTSQYRTSIAIINYFKKNLYVSGFAILCALINLGLNVILIPHHGVMGAAVTTLISSFLYTVLVITYAKKLKNFKIDFCRVGLVSITLFLVVAIDYYVSNNVLVSFLSIYTFKTIIFLSFSLVLVKISNLFNFPKLKLNE